MKHSGSTNVLTVAELAVNNLGSSSSLFAEWEGNSEYTRSVDFRCVCHWTIWDVNVLPLSWVMLSYYESTEGSPPGQSPLWGPIDGICDRKPIALTQQHMVCDQYSCLSTVWFRYSPRLLFPESVVKIFLLTMYTVKLHSHDTPRNDPRYLNIETQLNSLFSQQGSASMSKEPMENRVDAASCNNWHIFKDLKCCMDLI